MKAGAGFASDRRRAPLALIVAAALGVGIGALSGGPALASGETSPSGTGTGTSSTGTGTTSATTTTTPACPQSNPPNELELMGGSPQTAQLDTAFAESLQVTLANTNGCPITAAVGTPITFSAPPSGPSAIFKASGSDTLTIGAGSQGSAQAGMLSANDTPGSYTITATSAYGSVSFSLSNSAAGIPAQITPISSTSQSALVKSSYATPLAVRVSDANGTPVVGVSVTFALGSTTGGGTGGDSAGASFTGGSTQATETTNSQGVATSPSLSANATPGTLIATASVELISEPASFQLDNLPASAPKLRRVGQQHRSAVIDTRYGRPLQVAVSGADGTPVQGASVTFTLGSTGATGGSTAGAQFMTGSTQATATTGPKGIATSPPLTANSVAGTLSATAVLQGTSQSTRFSLSNHAGPAAKLATGVGASQSTPLGDPFAIALAVTVTDAHGNPVGGVSVTFTAPSSGASGTFHGARSMTVHTNKRGIAIAPTFTANHQPGGYVVKASVRHVKSVAFGLINTPAQRS